MRSNNCEESAGYTRGLVESLVSSASIEVIPVKGAEDRVLAAPRGATLTITCSPKFGLERTFQHTAAAVRNGYTVIPHLAARMVEDENALRDFVSRIVDLGVDDLYVIGGDADEPIGKYGAAAEVLDALQGFDHGLRRIGVGCYPEGHPKIADAALQEALMHKQVHADYMVSQLCFDSDALVRWIDGSRAAGVALPLRVGLAAPIKTAKLVELSLKIGVGQSVRYLTKQHGMVGGMLLGRSYAPETLLRDIGPRLGSAELNIEGIHLFSFNQVDATIDWQRRLTTSGV